MSNSLADLLKHHLETRQWSAARLSKASGVSKQTISNWTTAITRSAQWWQPLARIAGALDLGRAETDALLAAGGQPSLDVLLAQSMESQDRELLARWVRVNHAFSFQAPIPITTFIGRIDEMAELSSMLSAAREVTIVGFGGYGKTRLALEVVRVMRHAFDGVYFVDLAAIRDPKAVIPAIAEALGYRRVRDEPLVSALIAWLRDVRVLLLLDNVEQVLDAAADVANLLRHTDHLKILVTSRVPINIRGEHIFTIDPLPLPDRQASPSVLRQNPAVALFVDRARRVDRHFETSVSNLHRIADICLRLDGLPLAIELAAAQTREVPLARLQDHFPSRMEVAARGPRDVYERQRTLRATISWSVALLDDEARRLFTVLSVFMGGFTRDAAVAVGVAVGLAGSSIGDVLDSLEVHQFVRMRPNKDDVRLDRFQMLETIREYAIELLNASDLQITARRAHAMYYVELAERADMQSDGQGWWLDRLEGERDNVRAALDWCSASGEREVGLRLCLANMPLWELREPSMESFARLQTFMEYAPEVAISSTLWARGLVAQGLLLLRATGALDAASVRFHEALAIYRREEDLDGQCRALQAIGDVGRYRQEWVRASEWYQESLDLAEQVGSPYLLAHGYMGLALCAQELPGSMDEAERLSLLTLQWAERSGHRATIAQAANSMGEMARHREAWSEAEHYYEHARVMAIEIANTFRIAMVLHNLGYVAIGLGNLRLARGRFDESLRLYERMQDRKGIAECLAGFARLEVTAGKFRKSARLCGASAALLGVLGAQLDTMDQADFDRTIATLRARLGAQFEILEAEGRTLPIATLLA